MDTNIRVSFQVGLNEIILKSSKIKINMESIGDTCYNYYIYMPLRVYTEEEEDIKNYLKLIFKSRYTFQSIQIMNCIVLDLKMYVKLYFITSLLVNVLLFFVKILK